MTEHMAATERLADQSIRKWVLAEHVQERMKSDKIEKGVGPFILISRETGAGGSEIACLVGKKLAWEVLDKEILDYMVSKYGTPRDLLEFVDEKNTNWIQGLFANWIEGQDFTEATYFHRLCHLFLLAARHGSVVIVGRGARFILPPDRGLSVRILAPYDFRVEQVLLRKRLSVTEARKFIDHSDRRREAFIKEHFQHKAADPHMYDLVINVEKLSQEDAANLIVQAARSWMSKSGIRPTVSQ